MNHSTVHSPEYSEIKVKCILISHVMLDMNPVMMDSLDGRIYGEKLSRQLENQTKGCPILIKGSS